MSRDDGPILVTGPIGTVGEPLLRQLLTAGRSAVAAANDPASFTGGGRCRRLNFQDPDTCPAALSGVSRVFLVRPPAISDTTRYLRPFLVAAAASGVRKVVFLSVMGVNR